MIVFDLQCRDGGETFEAWFRSNCDYEEQRGGGLVQCPFCQSANVEKAPMAPRLPKKGSGSPLARLSLLAQLSRRARSFPPGARLAARPGRSSPPAMRPGRRRPAARCRGSPLPVLEESDGD